MIYITGDKHREFSGVKRFCEQHQTSMDDVLVVLGDAGINYCGEDRDRSYKKYLSRFPITLFCVHGNHEMRPWHVQGMEKVCFHGGLAYQENDFPNILYAIDGQVYDFAGHLCLVAGGAYSVDKYYRLAKGWRWFEDEQPSEEIKRDIRLAVQMCPRIDVVLSHTCPQKFTPIEMFISGVDQSRVDRSTEEFLDEIEEKIAYKHWFCGHWHTDKTVQNLRFMFNDITELEEVQ